MKKTAARKRPPIQADQIRAIRRLAQTGETATALQRIDRLIAQYPEHKPLYALAWEIAAQGQGARYAVARALDWTRASPNSQAAWQALSDDAADAGFVALTLHAQHRLAALAGETLPLPEGFDSPLGRVPFEIALANDRVRAALAAGRFTEVEALAAGHDHFSLRNNVAIARFHLGDIVGALELFEASWQQEPHQLFALERMIALRLWTRGRDAAAGLAAPMRATPALRSDDALAKVHALLLLEEWQAADAAWRESCEAAFWEGVAEVEKAAQFELAGAYAALRLGDRDAMNERLDMAANNLPASQRTLTRQIALAAAAPESGQMPDLALGLVYDWFPRTWIDRVVALGARKVKAFAENDQALMRECDAHPDYLCCVYQFGGETGRRFAEHILVQRALEGDGAARQTLIDLLARPYGPDAARSELQINLLQLGLLEKGATVSVWLKGELQATRLQTKTIHADTKPSSLPPGSMALIEKAQALSAQNRLDECLAILDQLLVKHPDSPMLYINLAGIKEALGHPQEEVERLVRQAYARDPNYLFALARLAGFAARRGEVDEAKAMLAPLLERESYHFSEWRAILLAQIELARALGDQAAERDLESQIAELGRLFA